MELIDKDAVIAYIDNWIKDAKHKYTLYKVQFSLRDRIEFLENLNSFINTIEVKEVDLDKEISEYFVSHPDEFFSDKYKLIAKHFFELGLKAQKGE